MPELAAAFVMIDGFAGRADMGRSERAWAFFLKLHGEHDDLYGFLKVFNYEIAMLFPAADWRRMDSDIKRSAVGKLPEALKGKCEETAKRHTTGIFGKSESSRLPGKRLLSKKEYQNT